MNTKKLLVVALVSLASLGSANVNAATVDLTGLQLGPLNNPGSFTLNFFSAVADSNASLDFVLKGYNTLDGYNDYQDLFTLTINGTQTFSGSFNLGGGGSSDAVFGSGSAVTLNELNVDPVLDIGRNGGTTTVTGLKFNLLSGNNTFNFAYTAPGFANGSSGQDLSDEGWGIASASVTAVPEPEVYGMMLMGLGLMGFVARRRKND